MSKRTGRARARRASVRGPGSLRERSTASIRPDEPAPVRHASVVVVLALLAKATNQITEAQAALAEARRAVREWL